jgi:hypothetical protein
MASKLTDNPRRREALVASLAERLREQGSWCGETHVQKATYALQELAGVPLDFDFTLYKYGPFSFDLRDKLMRMRADGFLEVEPFVGYGPRLSVTGQASDQLLRRWPKTVARYLPAIEFVVKRMGSRGVGALERLATAIWVRRELPNASELEQAARLNEIKPHVSIESARAAIADVTEWEREAADLR